MKIDDYMLPCLNKSIFGKECMGCGIQRSVVEISKGNFIDAFFLYPAIYPLALLFIIIVIDHFKPIPKANTIIRTLVFVSILTIIINYLLKLKN